MEAGRPPLQTPLEAADSIYPVSVFPRFCWPLFVWESELQFLLSVAAYVGHSWPERECINGEYRGSALRPPLPLRHSNIRDAACPRVGAQTLHELGSRGVPADANRLK
jgi:hypothetical protein